MASSSGTRTPNPVRAHARATRGSAYREPGGPWDVPSLDVLLTAGTDDEPPRRATPEAVLDADVRLRPAELDAMVAAVAGGLRDLGVRRRDVVAWQLHDGCEALVLHRACWRLGAVAAPLPTDADGTDADELVDLLAPTVVVASAALPFAHHRGAVIVGGASLPARRAPALGMGPTGAPGPPPYTKLLAAPPEHTGAAQASDVAAVLVARKAGRWGGVVHTHRTLATVARRLVAQLDLRDTDTVVAAAPLWHVEGLLHGLVVPGLAHARTVVLPHWRPAVALEVIERERVTIVTGPVAAAAALGALPGAAHRLRSVRALDTVGPGADPDALARLATTTATSVSHRYGSAEAPATAARTWGPTGGSDPGWRPAPDTEVRVVDPGTGRDVEAGVAGELWIRGPGAFAGYVDEAATKAALARGGWLRTGDRARSGPEGLTFAGRTDGWARRAGRDVDLAAASTALGNHPAVVRGAVEARPDVELGERLVAVVELVPGATLDRRALRDWCRAQGWDPGSWPDEAVVADPVPPAP